MTQPLTTFEHNQHHASNDSIIEEDLSNPPSCIEENTHFLSPLSKHPRLKTLRAEKKCCGTAYLVQYLLAVVIILLIVDFIHTTRYHGNFRPLDWSGYQCAPTGAPPEIARGERHCEFDTMSFHWWPADAVNDPANQGILTEFHQEGRHLGHRGMDRWGRFYDQAGKFEIPPDTDFLTSGWITKIEHLVHCKYTLRQTHLWAINGYDPPFDYNHTKHCTDYLMDTILENLPSDWDDLVIKGTPWPEYPPIVSGGIHSLRLVKSN